MKKGFIFTLDATLAIVLALSVILSSMFYLSQSHVSFEKQNLYKLSMDSLAILEKQGVLDRAASTNTTTELQSFLDNLPPNTCAKIELRDDADARLMSVRRSYCTYPEEYYVLRRVFVSEEDIYNAKIEVWYR